MRSGSNPNGLLELLQTAVAAYDKIYNMMCMGHATHSASQWAFYIAIYVRSPPLHHLPNHQFTHLKVVDLTLFFPILFKVTISLHVIIDFLLYSLKLTFYVIFRL